MAEVAGWSISVKLNKVPRDSANEKPFRMEDDLIGGRRADGALCEMVRDSEMVGSGCVRTSLRVIEADGGP